MDSSVRRRTVGELGVLELEGDVDAESVAAFEACVLDLLAEVPHVVVDLQDTAFVDCRGLSSLLSPSRLARSAGGTLRAAGARPVVTLWFDTLGVRGSLGVDEVGLSAAPSRGVGP